MISRWHNTGDCGRFASRSSGGYHCGVNFLSHRKLSLTALFVALGLFSLPVSFSSSRRASAQDENSTFPLSDVKPGLKGVVYTIFEGDKIEKVDLVVIGVLPNALGPKQDVILVQLLGDKAEHSGVAAGMSGSPVYFDGKLAGALSLKIGAFNKEAIGGVTPIQNMLDVARSSNMPAAAAEPNSPADSPAVQIPLPAEITPTAAGAAEPFLIPIETPVISAGLYPQTIAQFGPQLSALGMTTMAGGSAEASPEDADLKPGDMVGIDLVRGDLSMSDGCTVTSVQGDRVLACGHPLFAYGSVQMPMSRAHVVMTLASSQASTKIITTGGTIGTLTQDRQAAIMGKLGPGPSMIPVNVALTTPDAQKNFHFEVVESPQLTPVLVALATYNGIVGTPAYGEGYTLQMDATIAVKGHTPVQLDDLFAPNDLPIPTGFFVATALQGAFARIYANPYEIPRISGVTVHVNALVDRRWSMIDSAWMEKTEVHPGETVPVKVLLRPYRGAPFIQEIPVTVPVQSSRGDLTLVVSDADFLNRNVQAAAGASAQLPGLEELIKLVNRDHRNDRLYATLIQPTPTMLVEDKELPNAPASEINILSQRQNTATARLVYQSTAGEWSVDMHQVITGQKTLTVTVK